MSCLIVSGWAREVVWYGAGRFAAVSGMYLACGGDPSLVSVRYVGLLLSLTSSAGLVQHK